MSTYKYTPVSLDTSRGEIRLITLRPGGWEEKISCTIEMSCIHDSPIYEALSYVWGDASVTREIYLDGQPFHVTTNLEAALRHLRQAEPRKLWIDAIFVDQRNLEERSSQILLMRQLFQNAMRMIAWLGESTPASIAAFKLLRVLNDGGFAGRLY